MWSESLAQTQASEEEKEARRRRAIIAMRPKPFASEPVRPLVPIIVSPTKPSIKNLSEAELIKQHVSLNGVSSSEARQAIVALARKPNASGTILNLFMHRYWRRSAEYKVGSYTSLRPINAGTGDWKHLPSMKGKKVFSARIDGESAFSTTLSDWPNYVVV